MKQSNPPVNTDRPALNESELKSRRKLVALCRAMLAGKISFFEGALRICPLRFEIGVSDFDEDLMSFVLIESETDHLPPKHLQHRWSRGALQRLQSEFERTEVWAKPFASKACENLINRFSEQ